MAFIELSIDLETAARKLLDCGEDEVCEFLDYLADAIVEKYGLQHPGSTPRLKIFIQRIDDKYPIGKDTQEFLRLLLERCEG